jgi:predicted cupin superfamily sugar epimerase
MTAQQVIDLLQLVPLPGEGGYFRETYRSTTIKDDRSLSTAIYYLLTPETVSLFHRLKSDEVWHFYQGDAIELVMLHARGKVEVVRLGQRLSEGEPCQAVVPAGSWQGAKLANGGTWALMGCTVAPGFEFADFELGKRENLINQYPDASDWIVALT